MNLDWNHIRLTGVSMERSGHLEITWRLLVKNKEFAEDLKRVEKEVLFFTTPVMLATIGLLAYACSL